MATASTTAQPTGVSGKELTAALLATLGQRATTYGGGHLLAFAAQSIALASGGSKGASKETLALLSNVVGGVTAALGKELVGEYMKTMPSLGATIKLPSASFLQREGPRTMAGFNDMWTAIAGGMSGAAIANTLTPALMEKFKANGMDEPMARASAMIVSALAQRAVSTGFDTISDLTSTLMKSKLPGATGDNVVNPSVDYATMAAGMASRMLINFGLTLPVGVPAALGQILDKNNTFERTALSNVPAWVGLNFWINAKMNMAALLKKNDTPATTPPSAMGSGNASNV